MQNEDSTADLRLRTKRYALRIIRCYVSLPKTAVAQVLGRQLLRSGTSGGAHYCEARRARSVAEFVSKLEVALQEVEECAYWLDLLVESATLTRQKVEPLLGETQELIAIFAASVLTAKRKRSY